ncbi:MAG: BrnT family toxin [Acidiferrobacterales bacterium]|nr:BrnT family toxin [Acidiferrobacterales bacterium]
MHEFEFDPEKSKVNSEKHGIDFTSAQKIWLDSNVLEIPANISEEPRYLVIGKIESKHWSAIVTYRNEKIRIISVRRSRDKEVTIYENI